MLISDRLLPGSDLVYKPEAVYKFMESFQLTLFLPIQNYPGGLRPFRVRELSDQTTHVREEPL